MGMLKRMKNKCTHLTLIAIVCNTHEQHVRILDPKTSEPVPPTY
jgi:hypothetical protein